MSKFNQNVVNGIAECTEFNDHNGALLLASEMLGYEPFNKIFTKIDELADLEGYSPKGLMDYRYSKYKEMMVYAQRDLSELEFQKFYNAF